MTFNAEILSKLFDKGIYVLGSPALSMELTLAYLKVVLKYKKPQVICILPSLNIQNVKSYQSISAIARLLSGIWAIKNYADRFRTAKDIFLIKNIPIAVFQSLNRVQRWNRFKSFGTMIYDYEQYGNVSIKNGSSIFQKETLEAGLTFGKGEATQYGMLILEQIIDVCKENNIELWIVRTPQTRTSMNEHLLAQIHEKYPFIKYADDLMNKQTQLQKIGLTIRDYGDSVHLNRQGMAKTSLYYASLLNERLGWKIVNDNFFAYIGESIEKIGKNKWRYTMKNMQKDVWYKFTLSEASKVIRIQDFSKQNYFDCDIDIYENPEFNVQVAMLAADTNDFDIKTSAEGIELFFMKYRRAG
jgi:hypothetical protein